MQGHFSSSTQPPRPSSSFPSGHTQPLIHSVLYWNKKGSDENQTSLKGSKVNAHVRRSEHLPLNFFSSLLRPLLSSSSWSGDEVGLLVKTPRLFSSATSGVARSINRLSPQPSGWGCRSLPFPPQGTQASREPSTSPPTAALAGTHIASHQCLAASGAGFPGGQSSQVVAIHKDFGGLTACGVEESVLAQGEVRVPGK